MKFLKALWWLYAVLGVLAILIIPIGAKGWFGIEPDPLVAVFAIVLAFPWTFLLSLLPPDSPWLAMLLLAAGIAANLYILHLLGRGIARWRARRAATAG